MSLLPLFASAGATKRKRYAQVGGQDHAVDAVAAAAATTTAAATAAVVSTTATGSEVATAPEVALALPRTTDLASGISKRYWCGLWWPCIYRQGERDRRASTDGRIRHEPQ